MSPLPRFELRRNRLTRQWRFVLLAANGEVIATSETYKRKQGAISGIKAVQACAPEAPVIEPEQSHLGPRGMVEGQGPAPTKPPRRR